MIWSNSKQHQADTTLALQIKNLRKIYRSGVEALKGIDLSVQKGDFFALLGANGAGKSTTIGVLSSLLSKTSGQITINGYDLDKSPAQAKVALGLVPQELNLSVFEKCEDILIIQAGYYGISRREARPQAVKLLKQLDLWHKRRSIVRYLSGGMKRRLMIARALMHQPSVLVLDEPTAGVDVEIRHSMWGFLREINAAGTTIILTTHYLEEAEQLCNKIAIIDQGEIIENQSMKTLLNSLHHQTFIFDTTERMESLPDFSPFEVMQIDHHQFELRVDNRFTLNEVFAILDRHKIRIHSMRNKTNRLEALFMDLIRSDDSHEH